MITKHVYVPVTEKSHPFCRAELKMLIDEVVGLARERGLE